MPVKQKCDTLFIVMLSLNQQHLLECLKQDQHRFAEAAAQGPNRISAAREGSTMYSGFLGLALILAASAAPLSRSIGTQPPEPKAGNRTQHGALLLGYPPHQS